MSGGSNVRVKVLIGVALAIGAWIVLMPAPEDEAVVVPARERAPAVKAASAAAAKHSAPAGRKAAAVDGTRRSARAQAPEALFAAHTWHVEPPPPPPPPPVVDVPPPPPPPTAPPLPFAFMGSYVRQGEGVIYFLSRGDRVYDVHVGEAIDDTYRLDGVKDGKLLFTYRPLRQQQALPIGDGT